MDFITSTSLLFDLQIYRNFLSVTWSGKRGWDLWSGLAEYPPRCRYWRCGFYEVYWSPDEDIQTVPVPIVLWFGNQARSNIVLECSTSQRWFRVFSVSEIEVKSHALSAGKGVGKYLYVQKPKKKLAESDDRRKSSMIREDKIVWSAGPHSV